MAAQGGVGYKTHITVAFLGLVGVLGSALIANWDKLAGRSVVQAAARARQSSPAAPAVSPAPRRAERAPAAVATPAPRPRATPLPASLDGTWRDLSLGTVLRVAQEDDEFTFTAHHPDFESNGHGSMEGRSFESRYTNRYRNGMVSTGGCAGTLSTDGRRTMSTCRDSLYGSWSSTAVR